MNNTGGWPAIAVSIAVGALGGLLAALAGLPAAWITGSMVTVTVLTLTGFDTRMPLPLLEAAMLVIGIALGSGVTPELIASLPAWPVSLLGLGISLLACIWGVQVFLVRVAGWDRDTAFFSSVPGALSYVLAVAMMTRADIRKVAVSQSVRVFLLIAILPSIIAAVEPAGLSVVVPPVAGPTAIAIMFAAGLAGGALFWWLRVPAGMLTGSLAASAVLHGTGLIRGSLPEPLVIAAFVLLGVMVGSRFRGADPGFLKSIALASLGAFAVATGIAGAMAVAVAFLTGLPLDQVIVAFAPGGLDAMTTLALAMGMDTAFVAAHQLARFTGIALVLPFLARDALRRGKDPE